MPSMSTADPSRMQWFHEARYGMFVHYGPFSQAADPAYQKLLKRRPVLTLSGLPRQCPDRLCGYEILKLQFASYPR